jgi:hypothetical protein
MRGVLVGVVAASGSMVVPVAWAGADPASGPDAVAQTAATPKCTDTWTNLSGGEWSTATNWSTGVVPGTNDVACITKASASYTVTLEDSYSVKSIVLGATSGSKSQTLVEQANPTEGDANVYLTKDFVIDKTGAFQMNSLGQGNVFFHNGTIENSGTVQTVRGQGWSRYIYSNFVNEPGGTFDVDAASQAVGGGATYLNSGSFTNEGTLKVGNTSELDYQSGPSFTFAAGTVNVASNATKSGVLLLGNTNINLSGGAETGAAVQLDGGTVTDAGGTGSYNFINDGAISGKIPKGQTVSVTGNGDTDIRLAVNGKVTNKGTFVLDAGPTLLSTDGGNSWISPGTGLPSFVNDGTFELLPGVGWSRLVNVPLTNGAKGTVDVQGASNQIESVDIVNDGAFDMGPSAAINLNGTSYGDASFTEGGGAVLGVTVSGNTSSEILQGGCSAGGCQTEGIGIAGTLSVTAVGTVGTSSWPIANSQQAPIEGTFSTVTPGYTASVANQTNSGQVNLAS